jgi:hypothetical protein
MDWIKVPHYFELNLKMTKAFSNGKSQKLLPQC